MHSRTVKCTVSYSCCWRLLADTKGPAGYVKTHSNTGQATVRRLATWLDKDGLEAYPRPSFKVYPSAFL